MQWGNWQERAVNLRNPREVAEVKAFLERFGLSYDGQVDYTLAIYQDDMIIATGSLQGEVLRNIAIDEALQGEGLTAQVVSGLMNEAGRQGHYHYFLYTKPEKVHLFTALGFSQVACASPHAALLETGIGSIDSYCREMMQATAHVPNGPRAALVVNCNPFTLGHQAVIAKAACENAAVLVLVVSEEQSVFPLPVRLRLIKEGLAHLSNVVVLPGGKYIISAATFPGYFTRGETTVVAQTSLDATVFATRIAPALGIAVRYVGDEPYCSVTNSYNDALKRILPSHGIEVRIMSRIEVAGEAVSASRVRALIRDNGWEAIRQLVPDSTYRYLTSAEAEPVLAAIRQSQGRH